MRSSNLRQNENYLNQLNQLNQNSIRNVRNTPQQKNNRLKSIPQSHNRNSSQQNQYCQNHHDKIATHVLVANETRQQHLYCEKCSIMLASQGFNIAKTSKRTISPLTAKMERKIQIEVFLQQLAMHVQQAQRLQGQSQTALHLSQQHYNKIMNQVQSFFKQIQDIIETQKYLCYNMILTHRAESQSELRLLRQSLLEETDQLNAIVNDIQCNMEAVETVQKSTYQSIMNNYKSKLQICAQLQFLEVRPLAQPTIIIPDIPKVLSFIAEKIQLKQQTPIHEAIPSRPETIQKSKPSLESSINKSHKQENYQRSKYHTSTNKCINEIDSHQQKQSAFSFESNGGSFINEPVQSFPRNLFTKQKPRFHPQEMIIRESLNLTEIRENDEEDMVNQRIFNNLNEQSIHNEEVGTSRESLAGYLAVDTFGFSRKEEPFRAQQTETLLII